MDNREEDGGYTPRKPFYSPNRKFGDSKTTAISKAMDRKEASISRFADKKELSIIRTSCINGAVDWCTNHPDWKKEMSDGDRIAWVIRVSHDMATIFGGEGTEIETTYLLDKNKADEVEDNVSFSSVGGGTLEFENNNNNE